MERIGYWFPIMFGILLTLCVVALAMAIATKGDWFIWLSATAICGVLFVAAIKEAKGE